MFLSKSSLIDSYRYTCTCNEPNTLILVFKMIVWCKVHVDMYISMYIYLILKKENCLQKLHCIYMIDLENCKRIFFTFFFSWWWAQWFLLWVGTSLWKSRNNPMVGEWFWGHWVGVWPSVPADSVQLTGPVCTKVFTAGVQG